MDPKTQVTKVNNISILDCSKQPLESNLCLALVRELRALEVMRTGERVVIRAYANAFLHHMVRNLVGTAVAIARGGALGAVLRVGL